MTNDNNDNNDKNPANLKICSVLFCVLFLKNNLEAF